MLHAVVIGIDHYKDSKIGSLRHAVDDAEEVAKRLQQGIHPDDRKVTLLVNAQATAQAIRAVIGEAVPSVAKTPQDKILLYFAGHGTPELGNRVDVASRYLVAHDTQYDHIFSTAIDVEDEVRTWFHRISEPQWMLLFIDACFSGAAGGRTFTGPRLREARDKNRNGPPRPIELDQLDLGAGRAILTACTENQVARESGELGHGIFTAGLLEVLSSRSKERAIDVSLLYFRIGEWVKAHSRGRQVPILTGRIEGTRMPLLPAGR